MKTHWLMSRAIARNFVQDAAINTIRDCIFGQKFPKHLVPGMDVTSLPQSRGTKLATFTVVNKSVDCPEDWRTIYFPVRVSKQGNVTMKVNQCPVLRGMGQVMYYIKHTLAL